MNGLFRLGAVVLTVAVGLAGCAIRPVQQGAKAPAEAAPAQQAGNHGRRQSDHYPAEAAPAQQAAAKTPAVPPTVPEAESAKPASISPEAMYKILVAEVALQRGHYDIAIKNYLELGKAQRDPRLLERAARIAVFAHDNEHALQAAKLWVELDPDNIEAREVVTALYIRTGKYDEAQHQLEALLASTDKNNNENGFMLVAGLLARQQDKQAALDIMQRLVDNRPNDPDALFALSELAVRARVLDKAEQAIKRAVELQPDNADARVQEARILAMRGKNAEALKLLGDAVKKFPKETTLRAAYARMLVDAKQVDKAYEQFKLVNKQSPDQADILLALGVVAIDLNKVDEGKKYFLRLNSLNRGYESESSYYLGRIAEDFSKDPDMAIKWYSKVEQGEQYFEAQLRIAFLLAQKGDLEQARDQLSAITPRSPGQVVRIYLADGQILREAGRVEEAKQVFTAGLEELPDNTDLLYARAMAEDKLGQLDLLEKDLRQILSRDPDNVDALNSLGYTLADHTTHYDEALKYIQRALELRPNSFFILDSMGWVQYRLGHYQEAVSYLRRSLEITADSEVAAHLTEVLWVMGDKQGAREVWGKALKVAPGNKVLTDVMNRLDHK